MRAGRPAAPIAWRIRPPAGPRRSSGRASATPTCIWGIENSGSLGKGFAQFLLGSGEAAVHEIVPHRTAQYRKRGRTQDKTDHTDALAMARLLQAEGEHLPRVERDDLSTELRLLSDHRDNLVAERTRLVNQLHAQMLQIDPCYAEQSGTLTSRTGIRYCHALDLPHADGVVQTRLLIVRQLTEQLLRLWEEIETVETAIAAARPGDGNTAPQRVRDRGDRGGAADRRTRLHAAHPLRCGARGAGGDRAGGGLVGRAERAPAQSGREPATEPDVPHDRGVPTAL